MSSWFKTDGYKRVEEESKDLTPQTLCEMADIAIRDDQVTRAINAIKQAMLMKASLGGKELRISIMSDRCQFEERISRHEYGSSFSSGSSSGSSQPSLRKCLPEIMTTYVIPRLRKMGFPVTCERLSSDITISWRGGLAPGKGEGDRNAVVTSDD